MKEPRRLRVDAGSDLERRLLGAGRARAPREARQRALVAATAALGTTAAATGAAATGTAVASGAAGGGATAGSAAASSIAKTGTVAMLKWLGLVGLAGIGAATAAVSMQHAHPASETMATATKPADAVRAVAPSKAQHRAGPAAEPPSDEAPSESAAASAEAAPPPPSASVLTPTAATALPVGPLRPAASPSASSGSTLPEELAMLDQARSAMAGGDPARALSILDGYTGRFPHASLGAEATVLRIEALLEAGDPAAARRAADAFLASYPQSPYAERVRTLLGESNP